MIKQQTIYRVHIGRTRVCIALIVLCPMIIITVYEYSITRADVQRLASDRSIRHAKDINKCLCDRQ